MYKLELENRDESGYNLKGINDALRLSIYQDINLAWYLEVNEIKIHLEDTAQAIEILTELKRSCYRTI